MGRDIRGDRAGVAARCAGGYTWGAGRAVALGARFSDAPPRSDACGRTDSIWPRSVEHSGSGHTARTANNAGGILVVHEADPRADRSTAGAVGGAAGDASVQLARAGSR